MIEDNQIESIKEQLISQINSTFPEEKKSSAIKQVEEMNKEQLHEFLVQNNLVKSETPENTSSSETQNNPEVTTPSAQCAFCSIYEGKIPSTKISESNDAIAILEINPLSEGHTIIIQKHHQNTVPLEVEEFSKQVKEKLHNALNPKDVLIEHGEMFGHAIINVIPVYGDSLNNERKQATPEQLAQIKSKIDSAPTIINQDILEKVEQIAQPEEKEEINSKNTLLPKRIP